MIEEKRKIDRIRGISLFVTFVLVCSLFFSLVMYFRLDSEYKQYQLDTFEVMQMNRELYEYAIGITEEYKKCDATLRILNKSINLDSCSTKCLFECLN